MCFVYGAITHCGALFQSASTTHQLGNSVEVLVPLLSSPTTPNWQRHQALTPVRFGLAPVSLAATQGVAVAFLSSGY